MKILITENQINLLKEYIQQADKLYFNTGQLPKEDRDKILSIVGNSPYFKIITDLYFHFNKFSRHESNFKFVEMLNTYLSDYNKNLFPLKYDIQEYNLNEKNEKHTLTMFSILQERDMLVKEFKKLPSIGQRNLGYLKKIVGEHEYTFKMIYDKIRLLNDIIKTIPDNEKGKMMLMKIFNNKNNLDKSLDVAKHFSVSFHENDDIDKESLLNLLNEFDIDIIQDNGDILVFRVDDHDTLKYLTCSSLWCFSRPHSDNYWNEYAPDGFVYIMFNFEMDVNDAQFMNVILPDTYTVYMSNNVAVEETGEDSMDYLFRSGVDIDMIANDAHERKQTELNESKGGHYVDFNNIIGEDISLEVWDNGEYLELQQIVVPKSERKQGIGSKIMKYLTDYADNNGKDMYLTPDVSLGASSFNRLMKFYKRFGFERNKDHSKSHYMVYKHKN